MPPIIDVARWTDTIGRTDTVLRHGTITQSIGLTMQCVGLGAQLGHVCTIHRSDGGRVAAEVVGFTDTHTVIMPLGDVEGIGPGSVVMATRHPLRIGVGEALRGHVLDAFGHRLDGVPWDTPLQSRSVHRNPPHPLTRPRVDTILPIGVRAIDGLLTIGRGQRVGIFAGSGVGKSTLLGMIAKYAQTDINVIGLIGERGREVRDFIERDLGREGLARSVVVVATSDQHPLIRMKGASVATAIAEYFRDCGYSVLLMMDSLTRYAQAMRDVGLAIGEPPATRGYPPSVFATMPKLLERAGTSHTGSMTAFYTVLVDGDDMNEPIADTVRGIVDGHIVLDRALAHRGHFPAIDVLSSVSRLMHELVPPDHQQYAKTYRQLLATYRDAEDLITMGAYKKGTDPRIDESMRLYPHMMRFAQQSIDEHTSFEQMRESLAVAVGMRSA
ncbi:MAG: FliI/YscN family ATPase [Paenibacillaceae bacterium]|nr:FliI/YscN family ATPase [Paenibacillaceae bacterium]